jgi:hypothetical protein
MNASNYIAMCKALLEHVKFSEKSSVPSPDGSPFDAAKLSAVVRSRQSLLPARYRSAYVTPLITALPDVVAQLEQLVQQLQQEGESEAAAMAEARSIADTLVGAVRDWGEPAYRRPIARFEAVVSNFFRSFLSDEQRANVSLPLLEMVPPLVTFAPTPDAGPFTLPVDAVKELIGATVGVVSLPGSYAQHPLVWPALAHETGGHDVLHADPGILTELAAGVRRISGLHGLGSVWAAWIDETASDVYGLLNIGPAFALSMAAFFSSLEDSLRSGGATGTIGTQLPVEQGQLVDPHPVDILRLYVALGVTESLGQLAVSRRHEWQTLLTNIAKQAAGSATAIDVVDVGTRQVVQSLPLSSMAAAARQVGKYIATTKLEALDGHSIQDIETWDDSDDDAARAIANAAASGSIVGLGDDAQLLAGATVALLYAPTKYDDITLRLNAALDDSYQRDPVFGRPRPQSAFALKRHARAGRRTPASPTFPIDLG